MESPGEDPLLNGRFGAAYTQGLQDNPAEPAVRQVRCVGDRQLTRKDTHFL